MTLPPKVVIREVGPREGFQTHRQIVPTESKLELISKLNRVGLSYIEIASFVRPDRVPQMADAELIAQRFERRPGTEYWGLYLNLEGFERAESTGRLDNRGWIYTACSESFLKRNSNTSRGKVIEQLPGWLSAFKARGKKFHGLVVSNAFGCSIEGAVNPTTVIETISGVVSKAEELNEKFSEISLADTVGWGNPELIKKVVGAVRSRWPEVEIALHLHDTRGSGLANAYAGLEMGVHTFDGSVGGMGGCPFAPGAAGNIASEELVLMCEEMGVSTGLDLNAYLEAASFAELIMGVPLMGKLHGRASKSE
ncbi:MAG: hydroxymethylglutaryl-CoA lyase [Deltaproteobacteria bacterium]|nr:hydroxymethylglutaryl-CoA lyase [Deltaproteobacteria bacterium]